MADGPLGRAREALLAAKAAVEHSPSGPSLKALEEAQSHMDFLLDTLPIPRTPDGPGVQNPGPSVLPSMQFPSVPPSLADELMALGKEDDECDSRAAQQGDDSGAGQ